ncbi:MAG TPA: efflux RND transporter periplasmic adaptor subunit [Acidobacteriaceae bacterium]
MQPDSNQPSNNAPDRSLSPSSDPEKPRNKGVRVLVWAALFLFFGVGFYVVMHQHNTAAAAPGGGGGGGRRGGGGGGTVSLTTAPAKKGSIGVYVNAIGTVTPVYTSSITSQVNGIVTVVHYTEGQMVRKGDPLIEIDPRPYRATLLQSQGILERDQGLLAQAKMDLQRYEAAWARNAIPKQTLDDQDKLVQQVQGTVHNDEGTVQFDQIQVDFCHIVSPITGRVGLRLVDPGNVVQANGGTVLAVVTQIQPITVVFTVAEDSLPEIQAETKKGAHLKVDAFDHTDVNQLASGTLLTLDNQIDTTTGTLKARALFTNRDSSLFPNQFVNAHLLVKTLENATLIPSAAVQHNGQAAFVYSIENDRAHVRPITVGVIEGQTAQVTGVNPGDVLATSSFDKLQENTPVAIADASGNAGPGTPGAPGGSGGHGHGKGRGGSAPSAGSNTP